MAITRVGSASANRVTSGSTTSVSRSPTSVDNLIVVFAHSNNETVTASISTSSGTSFGSWNQMTSTPLDQTITAGADIRLYGWYTFATATSSSTALVTWSSAPGTAQMVLMEYDGVETVSPVDVIDTDQTDLASGTVHADGISLTPTYDNSLLIVYGGMEFAHGGATATGSWVAQNAANERYYQDQIQTTATTVTGDWNATNTNRASADYGVVFKEAGAGGGGGGSTADFMLMGVG